MRERRRRLLLEWSEQPALPSGSSTAPILLCNYDLSDAVCGCDGGRVIAPTAANGPQRAGALAR